MSVPLFDYMTRTEGIVDVGFDSMQGTITCRSSRKSSSVGVLDFSDEPIMCSFPTVWPAYPAKDKVQTITALALLHDLTTTVYISV